MRDLQDSRSIGDAFRDPCNAIDVLVVVSARTRHLHGRTTQYRLNRGVEGSHRKAAWKVVLEHVEEAERPAIVEAMQEVLNGWLAYRDEVAAACGLVRPA